MRSNAVFNFKKLLLSLSVCAAILAPTANADNAMRNIFNGMMTSTSGHLFHSNPYRHSWRVNVLPNNKR